MRKLPVYVALASGALVVAGAGATLPGAAAASHGSGAPSRDGTVRVCPANPRPGIATCLAVAVAGPNGKMLTSAKPLAGFTPTDVQKAYNLTGLKSHGATVAIVDGNAYPDLASDLATYRSHYGLPKCTEASGCLTIMNQRGGSTPPKRVVPNWQVEQALDVDMVSAACPDCKIIMVEANTGGEKNLEKAVDTAAKQKGVVAISNSYILSYVHDHGSNPAYDHPGIAITAGTGDDGYKGGGFPADDPHVVAVSGTSIVADGSKRGYSESAWSGTGSGCSTNVHNVAPPWQKSADTTCGKFKAIGDVSAAADPSNGGLVIVLHGGFSQVGGTSEATPLIAAVYALSGNTAGYPAKFPYEHANDLYDITAGSNGACGPPLCTARKGWDGVTGVGTPNGVKGF
jgi:subtilase family serine protease